jgi:hypothetical protein
MDIIKELDSSLSAYYAEVMQRTKQKVSGEEYKKLENHHYSVFYTNPYNTLKQGDFYFLGLNPAGQGLDPQDLFFKKERQDHCAYLHDKEWGTRGEIHRGRIKELLMKVLEYTDKPHPEDDIKTIFSSNIYFLCSPSTKSLFKYDFDIEYFFNWHKRFLSLVKPKYIICNGNARGIVSAFGSIQAMLEVKNDDVRVDHYTKSKMFNLKSFTTTYNGKKTIVIGVPHLSRHKLVNSSVGQRLYNDIEKLIKSY